MSRSRYPSNQPKHNSVFPCFFSLCPQFWLIVKYVKTYPLYGSSIRYIALFLTFCYCWTASPVDRCSIADTDPINIAEQRNTTQNTFLFSITDHTLCTFSAMFSWDNFLVGLTKKIQSAHSQQLRKRARTARAARVCCTTIRNA